MSTQYYLLEEPITHLHLLEQGGHDALVVWVEHGMAGRLVLPKNTAHKLLRLFMDRYRPVLRTYFDGLTVLDETVHDGTTIISETGEITTVKRVKEKNS